MSFGASTRLIRPRASQTLRASSAALRSAPVASPVSTRVACFHHDTEFEKDLNMHRSDAEARIKEAPIIHVDKDLAVCDGGGGATGHPAEYIALPPDGTPRPCIYCGLKYAKKVHEEHIQWPDWGDYKKRA